MHGGTNIKVTKGEKRTCDPSSKGITEY